MKKLLLNFIAWLVRILPSRWLLRSLFKLDRFLYVLQQRAAVAYGDGVHPKHRLTNYHQFFANRLSEGEKVIDLGCGIGALAFSMAEAGANVTGIDINAKSLSQARGSYSHPRVEFIHGDILKTEFDAPFDVAVMSNVLEHLEERPAFLRKVTERVQPKRWLIRVPLFERDWRVPLKKEVGVDYRLDPTHYIEFTQEIFADEMEQANLDITHLEIRWGEIWSELKPKS